MIIRVQKISPDARVPIRVSDHAVGYDVFAYRILNKDRKEPSGETFPYVLGPGESVLIGIGVLMAVPWPIQCEVRPRSGLASKHDIELSNSPGTIDPDYRGEASVLLRNRGKRPFTIEKDMRIAQLIFSQVEIPVLETTEELPPTRRGAGGFGSTGLFGSGDTTDYEKEGARRNRHFLALTTYALHSLSREERALRNVCVIVRSEWVTSLKHGLRCTAKDFSQHVPLTTTLRLGFDALEGAAMYLVFPPCISCAKIIGETNIEELVLPKNVRISSAVKRALSRNNVVLRRVNDG